MNGNGKPDPTAPGYRPTAGDRALMSDRFENCVMGQMAALRDDCASVRQVARLHDERMTEARKQVGALAGDLEEISGVARAAVGNMARMAKRLEAIEAEIRTLRVKAAAREKVGQ